jgi:hypothetical protein
MSHEGTRRTTRTSDYLPAVETIDVRFGFPMAAPPVAVYLKHSAAPLWCAAGGKWHAERNRAIRFSSNIDALIYCQALRLNGIIVGVDGYQRQIYQLKIDRLLELVCGDALSCAFLDKL